VAFKNSKMCFQPGLRPDLLGETHDAPPDLLVGWGGDTPHHTHYPTPLGVYSEPKRLNCLPFGARYRRFLRQAWV